MRHIPSQHPHSASIPASTLRRPAIARATRIIIAAALCLTAACALSRASAQNNKFRSLSGTVTDAQHEPLSGAVVELQNEGDKSVISFLSDKNGHYDFKRIGANTDYTFWATYRNHRSKTHSLSKFNNKTSDVVDLEIKLD